MSSKRAYHHGNLRAALVEAALEVIDESGAEGLSVREVARRAGVSSGAPFRHFADKNELLAAVAEEALLEFSEAIMAGLQTAPDDPIIRFQSVGVAFVQFAADHPAHFRVMFRPELAEVDSDTVRTLRERSRALFRQLVVEGQAAGRLRPGPPEPIMLAAYALCYGLARFYVDGLESVIGVPDASPKDVATMLTELLGEGIES